MERQKTNILGVWIDRIGEREALERAWSFLDESYFHLVVTPNPEFLLLALHDKTFRTILNTADLSIPDGVGLSVASILFGDPLPSRITGVDFFEALVERAANDGASIYLFGGKVGVAEQVEKELERRYPNVRIVGARSGGNVTVDGDHDDERLLADIQEKKPTILFVALGQGKQEKWIWKHRDLLPSVRLAMGVGGTFDYIARVIPRAPRWLRAMGGEWLFRLVREPWRLPRIWNATVRFLYYIFLWRYRMMTAYRPNVMGCVLDQNDRVLLIRRKRSKEEHWQLPQGGIDAGETPEEAVIREMREEIGTDQLSIIASFPHFHRYSFPPGHPRYGYRGQDVTAFLLRFHGTDVDIHIDQREASDWKWFTQEDALKKMYTVRRPAFKRLLEEYQHFNKSL